MSLKSKRSSESRRHSQLGELNAIFSTPGGRPTSSTAARDQTARLHEEAFRTFGGSVTYVVLDNPLYGIADANANPIDRMVISTSIVAIAPGVAATFNTTPVSTRTLPGASPTVKLNL